MPFAEIIEPREIAPLSSEEGAELAVVARGISHEVGLRASPALHGDVNDAEYAVAHMLTH